MKKNNVYKVVQILNSETLIINAGKNNGIMINDIFNILGTKVNVIDPDTKETLGTIRNTKETVTVTKVFDKMCECSHFTNSSLINIANSFSSMYTSYKKQLDVDPSQITLTAEDEKTIKVGDEAILKERTILPAANKNTKKNTKKKH